MMSDRWRATKRAFHDAVELQEPQRTAYLTRVCAGDPDLLTEVQRLLKQHGEMGGFLESPASDHSPVFEPGSVIAGRFRIVQFVGAGGTGEVFEAEDLELEDRVALKAAILPIRLDPLAQARFRREVRIARHVTHPNVCRVFDIGYHRTAAGEIVFLTMEFLAGESLSNRLRRTGPLRTDEALPWIGEICAGLAAAHRIGILHGDLKCGNIMLTPGDGGAAARILDFGLARFRIDSQGRNRRSVNGGPRFGTLEYLAPEQLDSGEMSPASDIYSMGVVIYEMMTGRRPYSFGSDWDLAMRSLADAPVARPRDSNPHVPAEWESVILRCLDRDPARRFGSVGDLLHELMLCGSSRRS